MKAKISILLCALMIVGALACEAKKKSLGHGVYWELNGSVLTISGHGPMPNYGWDKKKAPWKGKSDQIVKVVIEPGVTSIGSCAFSTYKCTYNIHSVTIPNSVTSIGWAAFADTPLTSVVIPNSVTSIGRFAFCNSRLTSVVIPNSVKHIGQNAFYETPLTSVVIPNSVTSIENCVFGRTRLASVVIPNSVTSITYGAFRETPLTSVEIPNSVTSIGAEAFNETRLTSVVIPNSVTFIGNWAFAYTPLTSVEIPNSVTSIGYDAFLDFKGEIISLPTFVMNSSDPEKWGFSKSAVEAYKNSARDADGKVIVAAKEGQTFIKKTSGNTTYFLVTEGNNRGIVDDNGNWLLPLEFKKIELVTKNGKELFAVENHNSSKGLVDTNGRWIVPLSSDYSEIITESRSIYYKVNKDRYHPGPFGLYDSNGNVVLHEEYQEIKYLGGNYVKYKRDGFCGVITLNGEVLIPHSRGYTDISDYDHILKVFRFSKNDDRFTRTGECDETGRQLSIKETEKPKDNARSTVPTNVSSKWKDTRIFDLKGNVKSCVWHSSHLLGIVGEVFKGTVKFNSDGAAVWPKEFQNQNNAGIDGTIILAMAGDNSVRKGVGRLEHNEVYRVSNSDIEWYVNWDSSGSQISKMEKVDFMEGKTLKFHYDNNGNIVKCAEYWDEYGDSPVTDYIYRYLSFDAKGNWTKRECVEKRSSGSKKYTESRTIAYY